MCVCVYVWKSSLNLRRLLIIDNVLYLVGIIYGILMDNLNLLIV